MRRLYTPKVILYFLTLLVLDMTLAPLLAIGDNRFFLTFLMVIYFGFQWGWKQILPAACAAGILRDFVSSGPVGIETASLILSALFLDLTVQKIEREPLALRMLCAMVFTFSVLLIQLVISIFLTGIQYKVWYYLSVALGSSVYTAVLAPVFFLVSSKWFGDRTVIKQYDLFQS